MPLLPSRLRNAFGRTVAHIRYRLWRSVHPSSPFAERYVARAVRDERSDGSHYALIANRKVVTGHSAFNAKSQALANRVVAHLRSNGLTRTSTCIDYGCGSLRIGAPLIAWLDPGRYVGLDVTDVFYTAGMKAIEPETLKRMAPQLSVIGDRVIREIRELSPDLLFSFAVVQHVPPGEIGTYFGNIAAAMSQGTVAWIYFKAAGRTVQVKPDSWRYSTSDLAAAARSAGPGLVAQAFDDSAEAGAPRIGQGYVALRLVRSDHDAAAAPRMSAA